MLIASSQVLTSLLPVCAGISFSGIGIAYQLAARRRVTPLRVFLILALCGTAFFATKWLAGHPADFSLRAVILGVIAGACQYYAMVLAARAMTLGPFSLVWCMLALNFAPVILYAQLIQGIDQPVTQWLAAGAAALCCMLATMGHGAGSTSPPSPRTRLAYGLLLAAVLVVNALPIVAIQDLTQAVPNSLDLFFVCMYASIALCCFLDALAAREIARTFREAWRPGLLAGVGSTLGMVCLGAASSSSGAGAFLINSMVTLILPMLAAVLVFHERATPRWIGTLTLGLIAIVLSSMK